MKSELRVRQPSGTNLRGHHQSQDPKLLLQGDQAWRSKKVTVGQYSQSREGEPGSAWPYLQPVKLSLVVVV